MKLWHGVLLVISIIWLVAASFAICNIFFGLTLTPVSTTPQIAPTPTGKTPPHQYVPETASKERQVLSLAEAFAGLRPGSDDTQEELDELKRQLEELRRELWLHQVCEHPPPRLWD